MRFVLVAMQMVAVIVVDTLPTLESSLFLSLSLAFRLFPPSHRDSVCAATTTTRFLTANFPLVIVVSAHRLLHSFPPKFV